MVVSYVSLENIDIMRRTKLFSKLFLSCGFIADQADNGIIGVAGEYLDKTELR